MVKNRILLEITFKSKKDSDSQSESEDQINYSRPMKELKFCLEKPPHKASRPIPARRFSYDFLLNLYPRSELPRGP